MRNPTSRVWTVLGGIVVGLTLVALVIARVDAGLVNLVGSTIFIFVAVICETRRLWSSPRYWFGLGTAFVAHCVAVAFIVGWIGTQFPTAYDFIVGFPEMVGLYFYLIYLAAKD
jgi:hypothetical protein